MPSLTLINSVNKYTSAGQVLADVLKKFIPSVTSGKKVLDLCIECVYPVDHCNAC